MHRAGPKHHGDRPLSQDRREDQVRHPVHRLERVHPRQVDYQVAAGHQVGQCLRIGIDVQVDEITLGIRPGGQVRRAGQVHGGDAVGGTQAGQVGAQARADVAPAADDQYVWHLVAPSLAN